MNISYKNKVVVVTGGASGIGKEIVKAYLKSKATVVFCDVNLDKINESLKEFKKISDFVFGYKCDVSNSNNIDSFIKRLVKKFKCVDIFVNNAGIMPRMGVLNCEEKIIDQMFSVNVKSILLFGKHFPKLINRGGVVLNAASIAALIPTTTSAIYSASKAAVITISKCMAAELAPYGIRVLSYAPGFVKTDRNMKKSGIELKNKQIALRRPAEMKEITSCLLLLSSDYASYMTGSNIEITGGKFCVQNPDIVWSEVEK